MGLREFSEDDGLEFDVHGDDEQVRPYVSERSHDLVQEFSKHAGVGISTAYDTILQTVLENEELLVMVLEQSAEDNPELNESNETLLQQLADKTVELGHFPRRDDINSDEDMYGFPIYIDAFGSIIIILQLLEEHHPEAAKYIVSR